MGWKECSGSVLSVGRGCSGSRLSLGLRLRLVMMMVVMVVSLHELTLLRRVGG